MKQLISFYKLIILLSFISSMNLFAQTRSDNSSLKMTFKYLNEGNPFFKGHDIFVYNALLKLDSTTSDYDLSQLINAIDNIRYSSNAASVFEYYFPITAHIMYYKPQAANKLLRRLVGPIFALGGDTKDVIIDQIKGNMNFHMKKNPYYLSEQGRKWVNEILPVQKELIQEQIDICIKELNEEEPKERKLKVINESDLIYELIYEQTNDSICRLPTSLSTKSLFFKNDPVPRFHFRNNPATTLEELKLNWSSRYDVLTITNDSFIVTNDSVIGYTTEKNVRSLTTGDSILGCKIIVDYIGNKCRATNIKTVIIKSNKGDLIFKNHNNIGLYSNKEQTELYLISSIWCDNHFLIYRIAKE